MTSPGPWHWERDKASGGTRKLARLVDANGTTICDDIDNLFDRVEKAEALLGKVRL